MRPAAPSLRAARPPWRPPAAADRSAGSHDSARGQPASARARPACGPPVGLRLFGTGAARRGQALAQAQVQAPAQAPQARLRRCSARAGAPLAGAPRVSPPAKAARRPVVRPRSNVPSGGGGFGSTGALTEALTYVKAHGGGTIAVSSQSSAATAIIDGNVKVAGIGGFSGRESDVSVSWLAQEVRSGKIRWVLAEQGGAAGAGPRLPGDTRTGSKVAIAAATRACRLVSMATTASARSSAVGTTSPGSRTTSARSGAVPGGAGQGSLYDCLGRAGELASVGAQQSGP